MPFKTTNPALARSLAEREYRDPTPVQLAVLAPDAAGRDLLVSARTGSGKTVAFGLAMAETLLGAQERLGPASAPLALVIAPTRELALQVQREFVWLYAETGARVVSCVGGMDPRQEQRQLDQGAHIVVGTPGRLRDHLERGRLDLSALRVAVLDEADEMLNLGFREDLEFILDTTPPERRSLLFSATMPRGITALARRYQRDAVRIEAGAGESGHADIEYRVVRVAPTEIDHVVVNVLRSQDAPAAIVFCNTREAVRRLHAALLEKQFAAVALSGELTQNERNSALQALRDGRARVCVATDVAARGIDLPNLDLVIHAELPKELESLQHRSGRTGRAGRKGVSVLLTPPFRRRRTEDMLRALGVSAVWSGPPTAAEIRASDHERMLGDALVTAEPDEEDAAAVAALTAAFTPEHLAAALARLYRKGLPAPEEVSDPGEGRAPRERAERGNAAASGGVWFRLNIGRRDNADPKWVLPLICRRGNVTRRDIGAIRISDHETAFEVSAAAAERFQRMARRPDGEDVIITRLPHGPAGAAGGRMETRRPGAGKGEGPAGKPGFRARAHGHPPWTGKPRHESRRHDGAPGEPGAFPVVRDGVYEPAPWPRGKGPARTRTHRAAPAASAKPKHKPAHRS